jgi:hypothetical protein
MTEYFLYSHVVVQVPQPLPLPDAGVDQSESEHDAVLWVLRTVIKLENNLKALN